MEKPLKYYTSVWLLHMELKMLHELGNIFTQNFGFCSSGDFKLIKLPFRKLCICSVCPEVFIFRFY